MLWAPAASYQPPNCSLNVLPIFDGKSRMSTAYTLRLEYHSPTVAEPRGLYLPSPFPLSVTQLQTSVEKQIVCTLYEETVLWFLIRHEEIPQFLLRCSHASICSLCPWERSAGDTRDSSWS